MIPVARRLAASFALALALVIAGPLEAQSLDSLAAGARVRVSRYTPPRMVVGTLARADSATVIIVPDRGRSTMTLPLSELKRVDVSRGARSTDEAFARGATTGALIGTGISLIAITLAVRADRDCNDCTIPGTVFVVPLSAAFTGVTTLVGGMIGVAGREEWRRVWPPR